MQLVPKGNVDFEKPYIDPFGIPINRGTKYTR